MEEKELEKNRDNLYPKRILLSRRLQMLAHMVTPDSRVADVGCDHGFLSIYLVQAGIAPRVIAMDVREGPLKAARKHIRTYGVEAYIDIRLSDGLCACRTGEVDTVVCAGMGGRLMERILRQGMEQVRRLKELILQPQSEWEAFRAFLREAGFVTDREDMVVEAGKYYPAMRVHWQETGGQADPGRCQGCEGVSVYESGQEQKRTARYGNGDRVENDTAMQKLCDMFGEGLLRSRHPVLRQYLEQRRRVLTELQEQLQREKTPKAGMRLAQVQMQQREVEQALGFFRTGPEALCDRLTIPEVSDIPKE